MAWPSSPTSSPYLSRSNLHQALQDFSKPLSWAGGRGSKFKEVALPRWVQMAIPGELVSKAYFLSSCSETWAGSLTASSGLWSFQ